MTWNLRKTIDGKGNSAAARRLKSSARQTKDSGARRTGPAGDPPGTRRDAGIVLHSTEARAAPGPGGAPELLYGREYNCAFCRGTGQLPNEGQCPICRGTGKVSVPAPAVRCAFCHGSGQVPPRSTVTCCVCKGSGLVPVDPPIRTCPECKGRGRQRGQSLYCGCCRGAGVVTSYKRQSGGGEASTDIEATRNLRRKAS